MTGQADASATDVVVHASPATATATTAAMTELNDTPVGDNVLTSMPVVAAPPLPKMTRTRMTMPVMPIPSMRRRRRETVVVSRVLR